MKAWMTKALELLKRALSRRSIEELFRELVALSRSLSEEQERHVRENLNEEARTGADN